MNNKIKDEIGNLKKEIRALEFDKNIFHEFLENENLEETFNSYLESIDYVDTLQEIFYGKKWYYIDFFR